MVEGIKTCSREICPVPYFGYSFPKCSALRRFGPPKKVKDFPPNPTFTCTEAHSGSIHPRRSQAITCRRHRAAA